MELIFVLFGLALVAVPFILPILSWVSSRNTRARVDGLEKTVADQDRTIDALKAQIAQLRKDVRDGTVVAAPAAPETAPKPAEPVATPVVQPPEAAPRPASPPPAPVPTPLPPAVQPPAPAVPKPLVPPPTVASPPVKPPATPAARPPVTPPVTPRVIPPPDRPHAAATAPPAPPPPRSPAPPAEPPSGGFLSDVDWESFVGVKLFSRVAGVVLALAAIYFLGYSMEQGWLQPPVRVMIGIAVAVALLVVCELKVARDYPVTANALDGAAIAILFATFFAAHALWHLINGATAFGLLALVTALAVVLSIRRESLFIAVLGLLGGFSTPILLSNNENRPIPLFAYLLLLNVGLAWVAYKKTWPILTALTLLFTTIYQWGWVLRFLRDASDVSLAMAIFIVFPLVTFAGVAMSRRPRLADAKKSPDRIFESTALIAAVVPVIFGVYLAAVPAYGARAGLLFGFLLLIDAGLLAIAIARRQPVLHTIGGLSTLVVMGVWLAVSYVTGARLTILGFTTAFVLLYLGAPLLAARFGRPLDADGRAAQYAGPLLLFVFGVLAAIEPAFAAPWPLFGTLLVLTLACAWRGAASGTGSLYFMAAFFAIAAQAVWAVKYLTPERLGTAVAIFAVFGIVSLAVPIVARRMGRPLVPAGGGGLVLLASLFLLLYLSTGRVAPEALWALALLLAILNAGLFVESAGARMPALSIAGGVLSWMILAIWWISAAGSVGVLSSLSVLVGLTLLMLAGHAWGHRGATRDAVHHGANEDVQVLSLFSSGVFLGFGGHLFLAFLALNRAWSLPPWPLFGALAVMTLGVSAAALYSRLTILHAAGAFASAAVIASWAIFANAAPWPLVALIAAAVVSGYALLWIPVFRPRGGISIASGGAAAALLVGEGTAILAAGAPSLIFGGTPARPHVIAFIAAHVANLATVLAIAWARQWHALVLFVALVAALVSFAFPGAWQDRFAVSAAVYLVLVAYPLVLGKRVGTQREPFVAAIVASATFFFVGRETLRAGGYASIIGALPVVEAGVLAILLRQLLRIETPGGRDLGRLALVAGAALAFITVAIPLQLDHQWITIGWAIEGAALAWLYTRVPHRGLLYTSVALLTAVFVRLAMNPEVFRYEPRGGMRILNWYLYAYLIAAVAMFVAAWWFTRTDERLFNTPLRPSQLLPAAGVILLFFLLNIEIADYYSTGPEILFRFGAGVSQDLTYTIGWLVFGGLLLAAGIYLRNRPARLTAVAMIAVTAFKCFGYDLREFGGLYRVASLVGLAIALLLVAVALQKFVLAKPKDAQ